MEDLDELEEDHHPHQPHHHHHEGNCCSHDHKDEIEVYQMSTVAKLDACAAFRLQGKVFFQETQWRRAQNRFQKILVYLDYTFPSTPEEVATAAMLRKAALLNCTVCAMKLEEYRETISLASQVLREWEDTVQGLFLKGKAHRLLGEYDKARDDLNQCLKLVPNSREVQKELHINDSDERCHEVESAELAQGMFSQTKTSTSDSTSEPPSHVESPSIQYQD